MSKHYNIRVSGKVQNVGFRYATQKTATAYGVSGFVKNEPDGTVYIEAEGEEETLNHFLNWCRKGPGWARVDHAEVTSSNPEDYKDFRIR